MSRTKRRIANLDPAESYKPQLVTTQWLDNDGVVRTTVHDGNFSPSPQEPTLVFVPAQFCDEFYMMRIVEDRKENPQQVENGSYKYLRAAFLSPNSQQSKTGKSTIDGNEQNSSVIGRISVKTSTTSDFSDSFKEFLEPYMDNYEIIFTDAQIEDWLESGTHTIKVEYNGEESETMTFTVASADYMYFEAAEANSTVSMTSTLPTAPNLEYSTDGETWQEWQHTTADGTHTFDTLTLTAVGDRVYLRGDNPNGLGALPEGARLPLFSHFEMTGKIAAGGNIISLLDKDMEMTEIPALGFFALFGDISEENPNTSLTTSAAMSTVTTIGDYGCDIMYAGCTSLTSAAAMPLVTTIGDYGCKRMYSGCTALTSAAAMPLVTTIGDYGCGGMYADCTALTSAATMSSVTTIGDYGCDSMYSDCTSLTTSAAMSTVTTIGEYGCGEMYSGCTALTSAAAMPSLTTIGDDGCGEMYSGCTFNMSDDGTTLNFAFPTPPVTAGETTYATAYDIAEWMGNTNGFTEP